MGARALDGAGLKCSFHDGLYGDRALKGAGILSTPQAAVKPDVPAKRRKREGKKRQIEKQEIFLFISSGLEPGTSCS